MSLVYYSKLDYKGQNMEKGDKYCNGYHSEKCTTCKCYDNKFELDTMPATEWFNTRPLLHRIDAEDCAITGYSEFVQNNT
jgi:hypothetical protein